MAEGRCSVLGAGEGIQEPKVVKTVRHIMVKNISFDSDLDSKSSFSTMKM